MQEYTLKSQANHKPVGQGYFDPRLKVMQKGKLSKARKPDYIEKRPLMEEKSAFPLFTSLYKPRVPLSEEEKKKRRQQARSHEKTIYYVLIALLIIGGILFPFWPREEISKRENRALAQMPAFDIDKLAKGELTSEFEAFYADQFPFREALIAVNQSYERMLQGFPGGQEGGVQLITAKKDAGGSGGMLPASESDAGKQSEGESSVPGTTASQDSAAEKTQESKSPETSQSAKLDAKESSKPSASQQERRKLMEKELHAAANAETQYETTQIIIADGQAMEIFYYAEEVTAPYADRVNHLRKVLPENRRVFSMVVPTAVAFYGTEELRTGANSTFDAIKSIYEKEDESIIKVDAYSELGAHLDEYLYFRTDHHWNGLGAYYGYVAFCKAAGLEPTPLDKMEHTQPEGTFLGSLYGYTENNPLLLDSADRADIYLPIHKADNLFYSGAAMEDPLGNIFLDATVQQDNHYMLYMGGDAALNVFTSDLKNGRSILVLKDSYANAMVPFLIDHYEHVYIVDPRRFADPLLPFIEEKDIDDVMMMNYSFAVSNYTWLEGFDLITGYVTKEEAAE